MIRSAEETWAMDQEEQLVGLSKADQEQFRLLTTGVKNSLLERTPVQVFSARVRKTADGGKELRSGRTTVDNLKRKISEESIDLSDDLGGPEAQESQLRQSLKRRKNDSMMQQVNNALQDSSLIDDGESIPPALTGYANANELGAPKLQELELRNGEGTRSIDKFLNVR